MKTDIVQMYSDFFFLFKFFFFFFFFFSRLSNNWVFDGSYFQLWTDTNCCSCECLRQKVGVHNFKTNSWWSECHVSCWLQSNVFLGNLGFSSQEVLILEKDLCDQNVNLLFLGGFKSMQRWKACAWIYSSNFPLAMRGMGFWMGESRQSASRWMPGPKVSLAC